LFFFFFLETYEIGNFVRYANEYGRIKGIFRSLEHQNQVMFSVEELWTRNSFSPALQQGIDDRELVYSNRISIIRPNDVSKINLDFKK